MREMKEGDDGWDLLPNKLYTLLQLDGVLSSASDADEQARTQAAKDRTANQEWWNGIPSFPLRVSLLLHVSLTTNQKQTKLTSLLPFLSLSLFQEAVMSVLKTYPANCFAVDKLLSPLYYHLKMDRKTVLDHEKLRELLVRFHEMGYRVGTSGDSRHDKDRSTL